ncbi:MAG: hypothetical protein NC037_01740 [Bacteroides sp.]|nr:hypothetical protein [Bacillota bacterium]MCM1455237.1 hypothetical protein [Bacteroides sp.]
MANLVSAVSYADIVFFVILALGLLAGVIGGLARAFKGFFKTIAIILISILIVGVTVAPISKIGFVQSLTNKFESIASGWGQAFSSPIYVADDGSYYILVEYDGAPNKVKLEDAAGSGLVDSTKGKLAVWLAERFIKEDGQTLSAATATMLTTIVVSVILFILYCILLGILCFVLRKIFKSMHKSENAAIRITDRVLGAVVSAGLAIVFMLLVLAILHALARVIPAVHEYLLNSPICGFLYEHNPISNVFGKIFG